ncbi:MAG: 6-bladed beta-propeller [Bacteroidales bacterium]|jgi:hypothetical protein|nr:6-bladed beta-propeller [Bacteroidales bacterium]
MNRTITLTGIIVMILISVGCREKKSNRYSDVPVINLDLDKISRYSIDSIATCVRFVPLETSRDCLIERYDDVRIVDGKIYVLSNKGNQQAVFVFDLSGKYLFKIDSHGRGPGEYLHASSFFVKHETGQIGILDQMKVVMFDSCGTYTGSHTFTDIYPGESTVWFSGKYYTYALEYNAIVESPADPEEEFNTIGIYDGEWNLLSHSYPVKKLIIQSMFSNNSGKMFSQSGDTLFFLHTESNVVYHIDDNTFRPEYILDLGDHGISEKELALLYSTHPDAGSILEHFITNELRLPGTTQIFASGSYILIESTIGNRLRQFIFNRQTGKSAYIMREGQPSGRVILGPGIRSHEDHFYSVIESSKIITTRNLIASGSYREEQIFSGPFTPALFGRFNEVSPDDNAVIAFFDIRSDFLK